MSAGFILYSYFNWSRVSHFWKADATMLEQVEFGILPGHLLGSLERILKVMHCVVLFLSAFCNRL